MAELIMPMGKYQPDPNCKRCGGAGHAKDRGCICTYFDDKEFAVIAASSLKKVCGDIVKEIQEQGDNHELVRGTVAIIRELSNRKKRNA